LFAWGGKPCHHTVIFSIMAPHCLVIVRFFLNVRKCWPLQYALLQVCCPYNISGISGNWHLHVKNSVVFYLVEFALAIRKTQHGSILIITAVAHVVKSLPVGHAKLRRKIVLHGVIGCGNWT